VKKEATRSRPRRKILLIALAVLIFIISLAAGLYGLSSSSRLNQQLADLRSRSLPTNGAELNAYYAVPPDVRDTTEQWTIAISAIGNANIYSRAQSIPLVGEGPTPVPPPGEEWAELEASRSFLKELDHEIQLIMQAADAGGMARYPIDFTAGYNTILPAQQETRTLARLLSLSAHVHAHDGQDLETLKDASAIFAVSESLRGDPVLISQLIRIAVHAIGCELVADMLPHCDWTDTELQNLQITIGRADFRSEMRIAFHGELALCLDAIDRFPYPQSMFRGANKIKAIELLAKSTEGLETSWPEALKSHQKVDSEFKALTANEFSRLTYMTLIQILPALQQAIHSGIRAEARQNCAIATIAANRFRLQHGKLPTSLADLQDLIPDEDPSKSSRLIDPFDEQPLRFKTSENGVIIYSIGENNADDGGDVDNALRVPADLGYLISE